MALNRQPIVFAVLLGVCLLAGATIQWQLHPRMLWPLLALGLGFGVILRTANKRPVVWTIRASWGLVGLAAGLYALRLWIVDAAPPLHVVDEPWVFSFMTSWLRYGCVTDSIMLKITGQCPPGYSLVYALGGAWLGVAGQSFTAGRIYFGLFLIPLALFTGLTARRLYGDLAAAVAVVLSVAGGMASAMLELRNNAPSAMAWGGALWFYFEAEARQRRWMHAAAGVMMGLGVLANQRMAVFGVGMALVLYGSQMWRARRWIPPLGLWLYALGGIIASLPEVFSILSNLDGFLLSIGNDASGSPLTVLYTSVLQMIYGVVYSPVEFAVWVVAVVVALRSRTPRPETRTLILLLLVAHLILGAVGSGGWFYLVRPLVPLYVMVTVSLWDSTRQALQPAQVAAALLLVACVSGDALAEPFRYATGDLAPIRASSPVYDWLHENTQPSERILAPSTYYLYLPEWEFTSIYVATLANAEPGLNIPERDLWEQANPDVIVIDPREGDFLSPPSLLAYIAEEGYQPVQTFETPIGRPINIYRRTN